MATWDSKHAHVWEELLRRHMEHIMRTNMGRRGFTAGGAYRSRRHKSKYDNGNVIEGEYTEVKEPSKHKRIAHEQSNT